MAPMGVHQVVAGAAPRDAITNHVLLARDVLRAAGYRSEIFSDARHLARELAGDVLPHDSWGACARADDTAILHYSIDSPAFEYVVGKAARSAIHYHNVTPPELLWRDAPALAVQCRDGRLRLRSLVGRVSHAAADSAFNAREINGMGFPNATVVGVLRRPGQRGPAIPKQPNGHPVLLFVGRGVPNKCQHDAILALGAMRQTGFRAELRLVGGWGGNRRYLDRCVALARDTGVDDSVYFLGSVDDATLAAEYARADLFLCLSEHEGYCVPILEAIEAGLPIVGFDAGAVPETLGDAGLLLADKRPSMVSEAVAAVLDGALADEMAAGRRSQGQHHAPGAVAERLIEFAREFSGC